LHFYRAVSIFTLPFPFFPVRFHFYRAVSIFIWPFQFLPGRFNFYRAVSLSGAGQPFFCYNSSVAFFGAGLFLLLLGARGSKLIC
jgi:hypothetical protein